MGRGRLQAQLSLTFDVCLRAETPEVLFSFLKHPPFQSLLGERLQKIKGKVDYTYHPPASVAAIPGTRTLDKWCWIHFHFMGERTPTKENEVKLLKWFKDNGTPKTLKGVKVYEHILEDRKRIQLWSMKDMVANKYLDNIKKSL